MQSGARAFATIILLFSLAALAFAGDAPKPATNPQDTGTSETAATAASGAETDPQQPAQPAPTPKAKPAPSASMRGQNTPGGEVFLGYSYVRLNTDTAIGLVSVSEHFDMIPGGTAQLTGNINNWFSLAADISGFGVHDVGGVDGKLWTYLFGPRFYLSRGRFSPFVNTLVGGARLNSSLKIPVGDTVFFNRSFHQNAFAAAGGGGLDWNASRRWAIRLVQAEYLYTSFTDNRDNRQNNLRLSGGVVFRFGYPAPPPPPRVPHPPTATCSANPSTIHAETGEVATIHAEAASPDNSPLTYTWSATGGSVDGTGSTVRWNPGTSAPGKYTVTARVDDAQGLSTSCSADVQLEPRPNRPPVCSLAATNLTPRARNVVMVGDKVRVKATASDPDNDPITYKWAITGGLITGTGDTAQFDSAGLTKGHYTVTLTVDDGRGGTGQCTADLNIAPKLSVDLHSVYFQTAQPTPKNPNGGLVASQQKTLQTLAADFKVYLEYDPQAVLTLHGHTDPRGGAKYNQALSERRVGSAKNFLVEHGVPADSIKTEATGEEHQLTQAEVKELTEQDTQVTAEQKARILKNLKVITLAQNRRVDIILNVADRPPTTSTRLYPFNAEDAASLISPRGPAAGKAPAKKPGAPAKKPAPKKPATKK